MPVLVADRVQETTNTTGTGTLTLAGALAGYQSFAAGFPSGGQVYYGIVNGVQWEIGIGTYTVSGTTLARTTVLASSNGGSQINISGASNVFCDFPATLAAQLTNANGSGSVVLTTGATLITPNVGAAISTAISGDGYNIIGEWGNATAAQNAGFALKSSRGTVGTPAATQSTDVIGSLDVFGYTGSAYGYAAALDVVATGAWTPSSTPTQIKLSATASASTTPALVLTADTTGLSSSTGLLAAGTVTTAFTDGTVVDYATGNGRISVGAADTLTIYNGGIANTSMGAFASTGLTIPTGVLHAGVFSSTYTDGTVVDYTTGIGRISVGAADSIKFYNGGIANTLLATIDSTGINVTGGFHSAVTPEVTGATYSQLVPDSDILVNFAGTVTLTLLNPVTYPGRYLTIRTYQAQLVNSASANVTINGAAAGTAILAATAGKWATLKSDGTNWEVIANN